MPVDSATRSSQPPGTGSGMHRPTPWIATGRSARGTAMRSRLGMPVTAATQPWSSTTSPGPDSPDSSGAATPRSASSLPS